MYARYFVNDSNQPPFEFLHHLKEDPDQQNLASDEQFLQPLLKMRARCDALIAKVGSDDAAN